MEVGRSLILGSAWMPLSSVMLGEMADQGVTVPGTVGIEEAYSGPLACLCSAGRGEQGD